MLSVSHRMGAALVMLALITAFAGATGGGEPPTAEPAALTPVVLKGIMIGDAQPFVDEATQQANRIIQEKINATMDLTYLPWAEWTTKYQLAFASGEQFDFAYAANWTTYPQIVAKHGFLEITRDLLAKYAPNILKEMPDDAWKQARVNGKIYMIPTTYDEFLFAQVIIRGDLRKKYNLPPIETWDDLGNFLAAVKKNEPGMVPFGLYSSGFFLPQLWWTGLEMTFAVGGISNPVFLYKYTDPSARIINPYALPEFRDFVKRMHQWQQAGYWLKNALADKTMGNDLFQNGRVAATAHNPANANQLYINAKAKHPDWGVEVYDGSWGKKVWKTPFIGSGFAIHATSKKVERALMLADFCRSDAEVYDLLCYGIKGLDWKPAGEKLAELLTRADGRAFGEGSCISWTFRNSRLQMMYSNASPMVIALYKDWATRTVAHPLMSLNFDDSNVKNEMAAWNQIYAQYIVPLEYGFVDPDQGIDEVNRKLKEAGVDKLQAEAQRQADEVMRTSSQPVW